MFKIISAIIGFFIFGKNILGALLGFFIGSLIDRSVKLKFDSSSQLNNNDTLNYYQQQSSQSRFATMLVALSAAVMRADGKHLKSELSYIKAFFNNQFGDHFTVEHLKKLKHFQDGAHIPLEEICNDVKQYTSLEARIQLIHFMFGIAQADSLVNEAELQIIKKIAYLLSVPNSDYESLKNMFYKDINSDYNILNISNTASDEEVKKAYRTMAIRYHPDKVAQLGEEYQKGAKEKFQMIQNAYENIKKQRGIN